MSGFSNAKTEYDDLKTWLFEHALPLWGSEGCDRQGGGFHEKIDLTGKAIDAGRRTRVTGRQIYSFSAAVRMGWPSDGRWFVDHGWTFMTQKCFKLDGSMKSVIDLTGQENIDEFDLYDHAFALFGLWAACDTNSDNRATIERQALTCLQAMIAGWKHPRAGFEEAIPRKLPLRSNPHMHLLEACLAWLDYMPSSGSELWGQVADEIAELALTRFIGPNGALREFFDAEWNPMPGLDGRLVEPGHQFEWAWLLMRWARLRGRKDAITAAKRLVEIGEARGINENGFPFNSILDDLTPHDRGSRLWQQTERIKAWLAMTDIAADPETRDHAFQKVADAASGLKSFLDVPIKGLWKDRIKEDGTFIDEAAPASSLYHIVCSIEEMHRYFSRPNGAKPAVFLDRDGVVNYDTGYVKSSDEIQLIPGAAEAIKYLNEKQYLVFIVTNQSGIGRGFYDVDDYTLVHAHIENLLKAQGARIDDVRFCPFHPDAKHEAFRGEHAWRKPSAGMLFSIMDEWPILQRDSILIGDKDTDIMAAEKAGVKGHLFSGDNLLDFVKSLRL